MKKKELRCDICGKVIEGYPNNAWPIVVDGICCNDCNVYFVIPVRIRQMMRKGEKY